MKKHSIYVDLGYRDATQITIVDHTESRHNVFFRSIAPQTEMDDTIRMIIQFMDQYGVTSENLYVPKFPGVEQEISRYRPTGKNLSPKYLENK